MTRYHFRVYTGPTAVQQIAAKLRAAAMPWQAVTIEGTEHIHYSIDALHADAAHRENVQWFNRAGFGTYHDGTILRTEEV